MYKEAYQLMKRADSSWWEDVKNSVKKGWTDFNEYADKNDWVRPVTYGTLGTGAFTGLGALMGGRRGAIIGASIGAPTTTAAGFIHNNARRKDREAANNSTNKNTDKKQTLTNQLKTVSPSADKEQAAYNAIANKLPDKPKSLVQKAKDKVVAGKNAVNKKIEERRERKALLRAAQEASGLPKKPNIIQRTVNKGKEKVADIKATREAKKQLQAANPLAKKPGIVQRTADAAKATAGKVKTAINDKRLERRAAKEQAAFLALSTPQGAIPETNPKVVIPTKDDIVDAMQRATNRLKTVAEKAKGKKPEYQDTPIPVGPPTEILTKPTVKDKAKELVRKHIPMPTPTSAPVPVAQPQAELLEVTPDRIAQARAMLEQLRQQVRAGAKR